MNANKWFRQKEKVKIKLTTSDPTGFLAAFFDVALVGLNGEMRSISGRFTGTGMEGIELFLEEFLRGAPELDTTELLLEAGWMEWGGDSLRLVSNGRCPV